MNDAGTLHLRLPSERWRQADPDETRAAGVAYLALRDGGDPRFVTNITVTGRALSDEAGLESLAESAYDDLVAVSPGATLERRETYGGDAAPGLLQLVSLTADGLDLQQCQVLVSARNQQEGEPVAALLYLVAMTGLRDEVREAVPELQAFLRGITVEPGA